MFIKEKKQSKDWYIAATQQHIESAQSSKNIWMIVIYVIITALIVGGGVYAWQRSNLKNTEQSLQQQIPVLQSQIDQLQQVQSQNQLPAKTENQQPDVNESTTDQQQDWQTNEAKEYENEKYGYSIQYNSDLVEIVLDDFFERGTEGNPSFRINGGGHFALGVWENHKNLTAKEWIDKQYAEYSGGWGWGFEETTAGKEKAYSALRTDMCYIEWIIIPKLDRFYTFGAELCQEDYSKSLKTFQEIVSSFKFTKN